MEPVSVRVALVLRLRSLNSGPHDLKQQEMFSAPYAPSVMCRLFLFSGMSRIPKEGDLQVIHRLPEYLDPT